MLSAIRQAVVYKVSVALLALAPTLIDALSIEKRILSTNPNPPPTFRVQENNPDFTDRVRAESRLRQGWLDMWRIATMACMTLNENDETYTRYFEPGEAEMVRFVFCNVAGIDNPYSCDLSTMNPMISVHMQDLTIVAGLAQANEVSPPEQPDLDNPDLDIFCTTFQDKGPRGDMAYTQVYKRAFDFPSLEEIFEKRGCSGLGQSDSGLMTSLGAHLLHEMIHWRLLVRAENNKERFDQIIPHTVLYPDSDHEGEEAEEEHDYIDDYDREQYEDADLEPATGYGPKNAHDLVINEGFASFRNADNYRWYGVSNYWSWRCTAVAKTQKIVFGQQDNNDLGDNMIPRGCDGRIPCP